MSVLKIKTDLDRFIESIKKKYNINVYFKYFDQSIVMGEDEIIEFRFYTNDRKFDKCINFGKAYFCLDWDNEFEKMSKIITDQLNLYKEKGEI